MATLPRLRPTSDGLKPSLSSWLTMHPYRQRAKPIDVSALSPQWYHYQEHGTDVLLYWYAQVRKLGEHVGLWGTYLGSSPSRFVAQAVGWELAVFVPLDTEIQTAQEVIAVVWGDDAQAPNRQRLHCWVAPAYRHPFLTDFLAAQALTELLTRYRTLWCLIPVTNRPALRAVRRWSFVQAGRLPQSEDDGRYVVDGLVWALTQQAWTARQGDTDVYVP